MSPGQLTPTRPLSELLNSLTVSPWGCGPGDSAVSVSQHLVLSVGGALRVDVAESRKCEPSECVNENQMSEELTNWNVISTTGN